MNGTRLAASAAIVTIGPSNLSLHARKRRIRQVTKLTRHKLLLVDDDAALLELYRGLFAQLPSQAGNLYRRSGARAMAMLEAQPFRLLICDLKMPKVDGLQVLSIVRRKYPELRTVALTSVLDEQFRSRAYALGVDLFWHKPATEQETGMFLECLESLLGQEADCGFRGVQSKSLVDIVQLECISQSSSVLRITNGPRPEQSGFRTAKSSTPRPTSCAGKRRLPKNSLLARRHLRDAAGRT